MTHRIISSGVGSEEELRAALADPELLHRYNELLEIKTLLSGCIIDRNYVIPDSLVNPIRLTDFGEHVLKAASENRRRVRPNEMRMAIFLSYGCAGGIFVNPATDLGGMRKALSAEIVKGKILYPWIFGRDLHDRASELYPGKTSFDNRKTLELLKGLPIGVFQGGYSLVGPFGCLVSEERRSLPPNSHVSVPGYLCGDETCDVVHSIHLKTGDSAVSKTRGLVGDYVAEKHSATADDNARLISEACGELDNPYRLDSYEALIDTVMDSLALEERRVIVDRLLRQKFRSPGKQNEFSRKLGSVIGNPTEFVSSLDEARLLQVMLLCKNSEIAQAVDRAVLSGALPIPISEFRISKITRWGGGIHGLRAEIGSQGVRFTAPIAKGIVARRLLELLHHLYFSSGVLEPAELYYLLDRVEGVSEQELLGFAVRKFGPDVAVKELVLGTRRSALEAANFMGIADAESLQRDVLLKRLLWKLGVVSPEPLFVDLERVESSESELKESLAQESSKETIRGHISNLFAAAEDALSRALIFSVWALSTDHYLAEEGFIFDPATGMDIVVEFFDENLPQLDDDSRLNAEGRNTLVPMAGAFSRLAKVLKLLDVEHHRRPSHQVPSECRCTAKPFAFNFGNFFLNLTTESQSAVIKALQRVSQLMQDEAVVRVRNATIHGNNEFPSQSEILVAIERISQWRQHLISSGLYPRVYVLEETRRDSLGNRNIAYRSGDDVLQLHYPTWTVAPGLPGGSSRLIVMPIAGISSAGPLRFNISLRPGGDPYWEGWPKRWGVVANYSAPEHRNGGSDTDDRGVLINA
jgi:hypothetical protein